MRNPEIQEPTEFQYYVAREGIRKDWNHPSEAELVESLNNLHRFTRNLVTEKERIQESLHAAERGLEWAKYKIWTLGLFLAGEGAVIGWLVKEFLAAHR